MIHHIAAAALLFSQAAAPEQTCLTRQQVGDIAASLTPHLVGAVAAKCRPHVGASSFLASGSEDYLARLNSEAEARKESAGRAFTAIVPIPGGDQQITQDGMMQMMIGMIGAMAGSAIKPESCADMDSILKAFSFIPPTELAQAIGAGFALAMAAEDEVEEEAEEEAEVVEITPEETADDEEEREVKTKLTICPA